MQRVNLPCRADGPGPGDERLGGHLTTEDTLEEGVRLRAPEQVEVDGLEVEELDELVGGTGQLVLLLRSIRTVTAVQPRQEALELGTDLLAGGQLLLLGEGERRAVLDLCAVERVVLLLEPSDDVPHLVGVLDLAGDLLHLRLA